VGDEDMTPGEMGRTLARIDASQAKTADSVVRIDRTTAVMGEKVDKLERIVYGTLGIAVTALGTVLVQSMRK
jgi:hypothetical protein